MIRFSKYGKWIFIVAIPLFMLTSAASNYFELSKQLDIFGALFKEINNVYVDEVEPSKLMRSCIDGMLKKLDPYTVFYSESQIENSRIDNNEKLTGIGIYFKVVNNKAIITEVIKDLPADKTGIVPGDQISLIDGKSTDGKSYDDISKVLKGEAGSSINLTITKASGGKQDVSIKRQEFTETNVPYYGMMNKNVGLITLKIFNPNAANDVKDAFEDLKKNNPNMKGIILDLRGNPGGLLTEAVNIVNLFVNKNNLVVSTKGKVAEWNNTFKTLSDPIDTKMPVVVLTDSKSASASEIVSGALQDYDRGVVAGQKTFGKGLVQITKNLSYGTGFKVTVAKYYIPSGRCIQAINYSERNADGSVKKIPDSLKQEFKTQNGRKVYDGGGVDPDMLMEAEVDDPLINELLKQQLIFDFATKYVLTKPKPSEASSFTISKEDYQAFIDFVKERSFKYETETEKKLALLKEQSSKEEYYKAISSEYESLMTAIDNKKEQELVQNQEKISQLLESEICNRYFYVRGKLEKSLQSDSWVKRAIEVLETPKRYNDFLVAKK
jgi:carboxyl-terminal processing protease